MPYKLLLADDSVTIQRVIELTFADEDVTVTAVGDGQAAIDQILAAPPDIVLADVGMPTRDGYEVAAFIKDRPEFAHIPVVLLTGAFEPVDEARARAVRCNGVLAKPFEPQLLIGRVKELLTACPNGEPAESVPEAPSHEGEADPDATGPVPVVPGPAGPADDLVLDVETISGGGPVVPAADLSLDDYFDRLDAAFATLSGTPAAQPKVSASAGLDTSWAPAGAGWSPADGFERETAAHAHGAPVSVPAAPAPQPGVPAVTVADAFAALLQAEQGGGAVPVEQREAGLPLLPVVSPAVTDAFVDQVAQRLVERLGVEGLQDVVARLVTEIAERLVREEIERLKAAADAR